jgi:tetratricopeptide (TPR) repeat protein
MRTNCRRAIAACALLAAGRAGLFAADARSLYQSGAKAQAEENYLLAVESYTAALAANPSYREPMTGLAESFFLLEEYDEALRWATEALTYDRDSTALLVLQARILIGLGRPAEARTRLDLVLSRLPNDLEARLALAECDIAEGKARNALAEYSRTLRLAPESRKALLSLALLSESLGDAAAASTYYETALRSHSADPDVQLAAAAWEAAQGRLQSAESHARTALSLAPAMTRARVVLGGILLRRGAAADAASTLRDVVAVDRDNPVAWHALGQAYRAAGDPPRAIASFASGLAAGPGDEICRLGQENTAIDSLKLEDPARRKAAGFHLEQGGLLEGRNSLERALAEYRRALILDPTWQDARVAYARVFRSLGFPAKYLSELTVIASLGSPGTLVTDEIEALTSALADSVSNAWGYDQYNLARTRYVVPVFTLPAANRLLHVSADDDLARLFAAMLARFDAVSVPEKSHTAASFEEAFRAARESGSDWFVILGLEESERSFSATADLHLSRTGTRVASFPVFRTGNDRIRDSFLRICADIAARLPVRGTLIARQIDQGLVDLGTFQGVKTGDTLLIVRKGAARLSNTGVALAWEPADVLGQITLTAVDEGVAEGAIARKGHFDTVNVADQVFFDAPAKPAAAAAAPARPAGLLSRLFSMAVRRPAPQ